MSSEELRVLLIKIGTGIFVAIAISVALVLISYEIQNV